MNISTTTQRAQNLFGEEQALKLLKTSGFTHADCSLYTHNEKSELWQNDNWQKHAEYLYKLAQNTQIAFSQTHAPFPSDTTSECINAISKSIKISGQIKSPYIVVHPIIPLNLCYEEEKAKIWDLNIRFFNTLRPIAKQSNVIIAIENMFRYDISKKEYIPTMCSNITALAQLIDTLGDGFCACLDTGHANLYAYNISDITKQLGSRLQVVHIHDNNGAEDEHNLPFLGTINWNAFCTALHQINFAGALCFETVGFENAFCEDLYAAALELLYKTGLNLAQKTMRIGV
ncbi:MAG: sugar phosphate isomerase/epimerase family protein [Christensenella sp.]